MLYYYCFLTKKQFSETSFRFAKEMQLTNIINIFQKYYLLLNLWINILFKICIFFNNFNVIYLFIIFILIFLSFLN